MEYHGRPRERRVLSYPEGQQYLPYYPKQHEQSVTSYSANYFARPVTPDYGLHRPNSHTHSLHQRPHVDKLSYFGSRVAVSQTPSTAFKTSTHFLPQPSFVDSSEPSIWVWVEAAEDVLRKASAAYQIVCTYAEASAGGQRWSDEDIAYIAQVGKDFNIVSEVERLRSWRDEFIYRAPKDDEMERMLREVATVKVSCEKVLALVNERERLPVFSGWVGTRLKWSARPGIDRRNAITKSKDAMAKTTAGITAHGEDDIMESIEKDYSELRSAVNIFDKWH